MRLLSHDQFVKHQLGVSHEKQIRELRSDSKECLYGCRRPAPATGERARRVIGFYVPLARDEPEVTRAVTRLGQTIGQVLADTGLSAGDLAAMIDLRGERG